MFQLQSLNILKINEKFRGFVLNAFFALIFMLIIDFFIGVFYGHYPKLMSISFPPHQTVEYKARDFNFISKTNRLGFRGEEFSVKRTPGVLRAVVIGNSFAYGWGINFEETWPRLIEKKLNATNLPIEVANLATPGTNNQVMMKIAKKAIPLLKPDLVIIAALQGGSTWTFAPVPKIIKKSDKRGLFSDKRGLFIESVRNVLPNTISLLENTRHELIDKSITPYTKIQLAWKKQAENYLKQIKNDKKKLNIYNHLNKKTIDRFITGELNVPIVKLAVKDPGVFVSAIKSRTMTSNGRKGMNELFSALKKLAEQNQAQAIVVSMPYGAYMGGASAESLKKLGFNIPQSLDGDTVSERLIKQSALNSKLKFISVRAEFLKASHKKLLFIPFDGHYNKYGSSTYANLLGKKLITILQEIRRNKAIG